MKIIRCIVPLSIFILIVFSSCRVSINPTSEIQVWQGYKAILSGETFDFGQIIIGEPNNEAIFTIRSDGDSNLILDGDPDALSISGDLSDFVVDQSNIETVVETGYTTEFTVSFMPTSQGYKYITVSIANNDPNENPFIFMITGESIAPDINVKQGTTDILSDTGVYDFGEIKVDESSAEIEFTVENNGVGELKLTNIFELIEILGDDALMFTLDQSLTKASIMPGETTSFTIIFTPTEEESFDATISIENNDFDENPYTFTVMGTGVIGPEIAVVNPNLVEMHNGSSVFDYGFVPVDSTLTWIFIIYNIGSQDLIISGSQGVEIIEAGTDGFSITKQPDTIITGGWNSSIKITFSPKVSGIHEAIVSIPSNDSDENPFTFRIHGIGAEQDINVRQGATDIESGTGTYDFGLIKVDESSPEITFTIENLGYANLKLTGVPEMVAMSGQGQKMFIINQLYMWTPVVHGTPTAFTITFNPTAEGIHTATISIDSEDPDEDPYTFTITGIGYYDAEINVTDINQNDIPSGSGSYDFGTANLSQSKPGFFYIENLGKADLQLTGNPAIIITGSGASGFSVLFQPQAIIAPSAKQLFIIIFNPATSQDYSATISIANNDTDENPYTFTIKGKGVEPEINVKNSDNTDIPSGTTVFSFNETSIGKTTDETFTIENLGGYMLTLTGSPLISITGTGASAFSVTAQPVSIINPGSSTTFTIVFAPTTVGDFQATVSIANTDSDENPYTFTIKGKCEIISKAGDFNGDGYPDIAVTAHMADGNALNSGVVYIYFGKQNWNSSYTTAEADVTINGDVEQDRLNQAHLIGDVNNDGFDDLVIGQIYDKQSSKKSGLVHIIFGSQNPPKTIKLSDSDVTLSGESIDDFFGSHSISIGDINNDGISDVIVSAAYDDDNGDSSGCVFVFFGRSNWSSLIDASNADVKIIGETTGDHFGDFTYANGDVNGDGINDLLITALKTNHPTLPTAGFVYIFFGKSNWNSTIYATSADVMISGNGAGDYFGRSMMSNGDINSDGISDLVIGALRDDDNGAESGCVFIFFGRKNWNSQYTASQADVVLMGDYPSGYFGFVLTASADLNRDGISDIVIGVPFDDIGGYHSGSAYIFYGRTNWNSTINQKSADIIIECNDMQYSFGESGITADINLDGYEDLVLGAENAYGGNVASGCVYIYFGKQNWSSAIDSNSCDVKLLGKDRGDSFGVFVSGN